MARARGRGGNTPLTYTKGLFSCNVSSHWQRSELNGDKMVANIMMQTARRASAAALAQKRGLRLSDFLDRRKMLRTPAPANTDYVPFPTSTFIPFLGIAKRWLPVIGIIEAVPEIWEMYISVFRPAAWRMQGWTLISQCGPMDSMNSQLPGVTCLFSNYTHAVWAAGDGQINTAAAPLYRASFHYDVEPNPSFPTLTRARNSAVWHKNDAVQPPAPVYWQDRRFWQAMNPFPQPNPLPMLDPLSAPYNAPPEWPDPLPLSSSPHRRRNPYRVYQYQRQADYYPPQYTPPVTPQEPPTLPLIEPPVVIQPGRVTFAPAPTINGVPVHKVQRPRRTEREAKLRVRGFRYLAGAMNAVTESSDAINAIYGALPKRYQQRGLGKHNEWRKLQLIYRHFKHLDKKQAVINLFKEQMQDMAIGIPQRRLQQYSKAHRPHGSLPIGYAAGPAL